MSHPIKVDGIKVEVDYMRPDSWGADDNLCRHAAHRNAGRCNRYENRPAENQPEGYFTETYHFDDDEHDPMERALSFVRDATRDLTKTRPDGIVEGRFVIRLFIKGDFPPKK